MPAAPTVFLAAAAFLIATFLARRLCNPASALYVLDHPNERSLHSRPTPRTGGIAIATAVFVCGGLLIVLRGQLPQVLWIGSAAIIVAATSFVEDRRSLHPAIRFAFHTVAAVLVVYGGLLIDASWWPGNTFAPQGLFAAVLTLCYVVWMIELYNFMDGMDGFAGGMTVIGFAALALLAWLAAAPLLPGLSAIVSAAALGFLLINFPPARIFMGDVGATTLGLLAAAFSLWGAQTAAFPLWAAVLIFSPFIVDATITIGRRAVRGEKIWKPHRTHYYQRLVQLGWGHRTVVIYEYVLMLAVAASAVLSREWSPRGQRMILAMWLLIYLLLAYGVSRLEFGRRSAPLRELAAE